MTARILEAVPNFSEGRDLAVVEAIVEAMREQGADVLDWSADADHHRSVVTLIGAPHTVEAAAVAGARVAIERIDLRRHDGIHPRIGALDVLPFVPLAGLTLDDARASARRVGARLADEVGVPVFFYGHASDPAGRGLAELRGGGFEALAERWPSGREPDLLPARWEHPGAHPSAGAACVGARRLLLAWNVFVAGLTLEQAARVASGIRELGGGFAGVRALALELPRRGAIQISMNVEDLEATSPMDVFRRIEEGVAAAGGRTVETEVIGMVPDELVASAAVERLGLTAFRPERLLSRRLVHHLATQQGSPG